MDSELKKKLWQICKDHAVTEKELKAYNGELVNYNRYPTLPSFQRIGTVFLFLEFPKK